jgi:membrane protease subunit HflC
MATQTRHVGLAIIGFIALILSLNTFYTLSQYQQGLVLAFGKPVKVVKEPGLHAKIPFYHNVEYFDKRLLGINAEPKEVIALDQKRLIVDAFLRYRITDPLKFRQTVRDERGIASRMSSIMESSLRQVLGNYPLSEIISGKRAKIMQEVRKLVDEQANQATGGGKTTGGFGIQIVDVRVMRADLPKENSQDIYRRMRAEREREAKEHRALGEEEAQKIRSRADKERSLLMAEAQKKSDIMRGEGDAKASRIFAEAANKDPDFFAFYRSMQAYRKTINKDDTTVLMSPSNEFMRYLR